MLRINTILVLSFLVFLLPFLGLPQIIDNLLYIIFGVVIFVAAFLLRENLYDQKNKSEDQSKKDQQSNN